MATSTLKNYRSLELQTLMINNIDATDDVITYGGGEAAGGVTNTGGILYSHNNRKYTFRSKGINNNKVEDYQLPANSDDTSDHTYQILTTKNYPLERQTAASPGGTTSGDGTNKVTFASVGAGRHAILLFADKMINLFCASLTDSIVYSGTIPDGWTLTKSGLTYTLTRTSTTTFRYTIIWI